MKTTLLAGLTLAVALARAAPANLGIKFDKRANALPTLTLPYGTWRAHSYDPNGDVRALLTYAGDAVVNDPSLTYTGIDLYLQEHPLRRPTRWRLEMGQACTTCYGDRGSRWRLWSYMHAVDHQGTAVDGPGCGFTDWAGCESVSGWNTCSGV